MLHPWKLKPSREMWTCWLKPTPFLETQEVKRRWVGSGNWECWKTWATKWWQLGAGRACFYFAAVQDGGWRLEARRTTNGKVVLMSYMGVFLMIVGSGSCYLRLFKSVISISSAMIPKGVWQLGRNGRVWLGPCVPHAKGKKAGGSSLEDSHQIVV